MRSRAWVTAVAAALLATGCAGGTATPSTGGSSPGESAATSPSAAPSTSAGDAFPVTVEHKYGSAEIPAAPERVVTVGLTDQDAMLALGITPVVTADWLGAYPGAIGPWAREEFEDSGAEMPQLMSSRELDFEAVAAAQPDLILGAYSGLTQEEYDTLSQIAPTVAQSGEYVDFGTPWQEMTLVAGRAVGHEARAAELIAEVDELIAETRELHPEFEGAEAVLASSYGDGSFYVYGPQDPRVQFLTALGLRMPADLLEQAEASEEFGVSVSDEQIDTVDVDLLIWFVASEEEGGEGVGFLSDPLYSGLAVAQEGRDIILPPDTDLYNAYNSSSVLSIPYALDQFVPLLESAVDGDPATAAELGS